MYRAGILLCIVSVGLHFPTGTTAELPSLEYSCDSNGKITIHNANKYQSISVEGTKGLIANKFCNDSFTYTSIAALHGNGAVIEGCKADAYVQVVVMGFNNTGKHLLVGGTNAATYQLKCITTFNLIDPVAFNISRTAKPLIFDTPVTILKPEIPEDSITMSIKESSPIVIGSVLTIIFEGPDKLAFFAQECKAYNPENPEEEIVLIRAGDAVATSILIDGFAKPTPAPLSNKVSFSWTIHAFHFKNSNKVTLQCVISVCQNMRTVPCKTNTKAVGAARKKRNSDYNLHTLETTIVVLDKLGGNEERNIGYTIRSSNLMTMTLGALWIMGN